MDVVYLFIYAQHRKFIVVEEFYAIKFADLIGAINCSINEAVVRYSS
jgi:hypothetical protein